MIAKRMFKVPKLRISIVRYTTSDTAWHAKTNEAGLKNLHIDSAKEQ